MQLKRVLALLLALILVVSMAACGKEEAAETTTPPTTEATEHIPLVEFPLEQGKTFTIIMAHDEDWDEDIAANVLWRDLRSKTNVTINIKRIEKTNYMEELNKMLLAEEAWDGIFTGFLTEDEYGVLAAQDYFLDISDMVTNEEICPNFVERVYGEREDTALKALTTPDGGIYGIGGSDMNGGACLESPILVNKDWVEKAGKKVEDIKTIEDLEFLLDYWMKNDMNGNGKKGDEIPYLMFDADDKCNMEAFLGLYGIATTSEDYYVVAEDGTVKFAPTSDAWKDAVKKLNDWYGKGYIWADAFNNKATDSFNNVLASTTPIVGMMTSNSCNEALLDQYVAIAPVKVSGYQAAWHIEPSMYNPKAGIAISKNCKDAEILLAWFDRLLDIENSVRYHYGEQLEEWDLTEDNAYEFLRLTEGEKAKQDEDAPSLKTITEAGLWLPSCFTEEDYEKKIYLYPDQQFAMDAYKVYKSSVDKNVWPRPYYSLEQRTTIDEYSADVMNLVAMKKAQWVTGTADIEAQFAQFVEDLNTMGVDKMISAMQDAYNTYMGK